MGVNWVGFATKQGVNVGDFPVYTGLFTPSFKENPNDFEKSILLAKKSGAKGISLFTVDMLTKEQEAIIVKFKE